MLGTAYLILWIKFAVPGIPRIHSLHRVAISSGGSLRYAKLGSAGR